MIQNNVRLLIFCVVLVLSQFLINNFTSLYIDLFAIVLVILLLSGQTSWLHLIIFSLSADLFGHWYLGSHLLALTLLSFFSSSFHNFYRVCGWLARTVITNVFFLLLNLIICLIDYLFNSVYTSWLSVLCETILFMPLIQVTLEYFIKNNASDLIIYD